MSGGTLCDDYLAQVLAERLAGHFIYHPLQHRWYCADPPNWRRDDTQLLTWRVRQYLRELSEQIGGNARASTLLSARKIKHVQALLRSERALIGDPPEWQVTATGLVPR